MYVCISEQRLLFRYEVLIGFYKGDGVFTARYELNLYIYIMLYSVLKWLMDLFE